MAKTKLERDGNPTIVITATVMRAVAAPMLTNRIIKIIDGRSLSSVASVAVAFLPLSMLNGSTAGAAAAGAGAEVLNQDGDAIFYKYDVSIKEGPEGFCRVPMFLSWCCSLEMSFFYFLDKCQG